MVGTRSGHGRGVARPKKKSVQRRKSAAKLTKVRKSGPKGMRAGKSAPRPIHSGRDTGSVAALKGALAQSEARFRSLLETAAAPILLLSPELIIREMNSEAERLYERAREDVVGTDYFEALDPMQIGGMVRSELEHVLQGQPVRSGEGRVRRPDGSERVLIWNASCL